MIRLANPKQELPEDLNKMLMATEETFADNQGVKPLVFTWHDNRLTIIAAAPLLTPDEQAEGTLPQLLIKLAREGAEAIALISEAWMVAEIPKDYQHGSLAVHPDRQEVVMVQYEDAQQEYVCTARINRLQLRRPRLSAWKIRTTSESILGGTYGRLFEKASQKEQDQDEAGEKQE